MAVPPVEASIHSCFAVGNTETLFFMNPTVLSQILTFSESGIFVNFRNCYPWTSTIVEGLKLKYVSQIHTSQLSDKTHFAKLPQSWCNSMAKRSSSVASSSFVSSSEGGGSSEISGRRRSLDPLRNDQALVWLKIPKFQKVLNA